MQNKEISGKFKMLAALMELHNENPFKTKSYTNAAFVIERLEQPLTTSQFENIGGIGKSISSKIKEILSSGTIKELQEIIQRTPPGIIEMMTIKGVGPKKIGLLWKVLGIESVGDLLYACHENRLVDVKGFGFKTQDAIRKSIEYKLSNNGKFHYAKVANVGNGILLEIRKKYPETIVEITGDFRRKCEVVEKIEIIVASTEIKETSWVDENTGIPIRVFGVSPFSFYSELFVSTGNSLHVSQIKQLGFNPQKKYESENEIYNSLNLPFVEPELREGVDEINRAQKGLLPDLIELNDLKGILHVHTTYSDGIHSLKQMAERAKSIGYEYLGISDHSQSAFYANGLRPDRILSQHHEIDELNKVLAPFKVFKGIESDILNDGSLDYSEDILKRFDFVIASIHSNLNMNEEKATQRLLKAIENPYTTILGHLSGRLLLMREGYPINHRVIIDACAKHNVIIELNAHPYRLDIDWRWISYAIEKGVKISINPDAHEMDGYNDLYYGVCVARKGFLSRDMTLNAFTLIEMERFFKARG